MWKYLISTSGLLSPIFFLYIKKSVKKTNKHKKGEENKNNNKKSPADSMKTQRQLLKDQKSKWDEMFHSTQVHEICPASLITWGASPVLYPFYPSWLCKLLKTGGHMSLTLTCKSLLLCLPGNLCKPMLSSGSLYWHFYQQVNWKVTLLTYQMLCKLLFKPWFPYISINK